MKKKNQVIQNNSFTEFMIYSSPNGKVKFEVFLRDENICQTFTKKMNLIKIQHVQKLHKFN